VIVVFDIGNVLLRWNPRNLFAGIIPDEARRERFLATACSMDFVVETDVAEDFSQAVAARAKVFPEFAAELRQFDERWMETLGGPIEPNVALLRRLRETGRPVHALSNFARQKFALARQRYDFLDAFDTRVISGEVGAAKPQRRIYEILFERVGRRPEELLFVDDAAANVSAAEALGMPAIRYREGMDLEAELRARGALR
jgi:2-haloacid dehalogenase